MRTERDVDTRRARERWTTALAVLALAGSLASPGRSRAHVMDALSAGPEPAFMTLASPAATAATAAAATAAAAADSAASAPSTTTEPTPAPATTSLPAQPSATEKRGVLSRATSDLGQALTALGSDALYVVKSPFRMTRETWKWTMATAGVATVLFVYDQQIWDASQRAQGQPVYDAVVKVGTAFEPLGLMGRTWPYWAGLWAVGKATRVVPLQQIPAEILESHAIGGTIRNVGKIILGRRRPFEGYGPYFFEFNGGTSYPSGHTSAVFEIATVLSHHADVWPVTVATYALATTVAIQRVDSDGHWASDCFVPAITGTVLARTIIRRNQERRDRMLAPVPLPGGVGMIFETRF